MVANIDRENIAGHLFGEVEPVRIDVSNNNIARSGMAADRDCHAADRPSAGDQDIFTDQVKRERGVGGVSQRIKTREHIERNIRISMPNIGHRNGEKFRERPLPIHSDSLSVGTKVPPSRQTIAAMTANNVTFASNEITRRKSFYARTDSPDNADKLMPHHHRH